MPVGLWSYPANVRYDGKTQPAGVNRGRRRGITQPPVRKRRRRRH